ncbi:hypothetical protein PB01_02945 [Psychrobacillus glaciei]|uniref:Uncharacterized protein n=1 Tax=Psychrobacillus glaciei TaxID=2283160 RepID=A0A5J6SJK8_9BACI|nr:hypothetical protein [Psychrobacillus glaciei]QFF97852.1 hypothetical protein PB01_02945 [Psychrobacillus glaciei]
MSHPYKQFEDTILWKVINKGIHDLIHNNDIEEMTRREYIVGYLCKLVTESETENQKNTL